MPCEIAVTANVEIEDLALLPLSQLILPAPAQFDDLERGFGISLRQVAKTHYLRDHLRFEAIGSCSSLASAVITPTLRAVLGTDQPYRFRTAAVGLKVPKYVDVHEWTRGRSAMIADKDPNL